MDDIPKEVAVKLCQETREENRSRWYSFYSIWCWGCYTFTKGDPDILSFSNRPDNRGCSQINKRYEHFKSEDQPTVCTNPPQ